MAYSAAVFDLDGTLLDTLEDLADACNAALSVYGFPAHPIDAYRHYVGDGVRNLLLRTLPAAQRNPEMILKVAETYRAEYQKRWNAKSQPYEGIAQMLDELLNRKIRLAVLSNKPEDFTRQCVSALLPKWKFEMVVGATAERPHKPHPAGALKIAEEMGVSPGEFLYLGDTNTDMQTALAAGMYAVGALWGFRDQAELEAAGAKITIAHPMDLLRII